VFSIDEPRDSGSNPTIRVSVADARHRRDDATPRRAARARRVGYTDDDDDRDDDARRVT
jgi:hypothetical protein